MAIEIVKITKKDTGRNKPSTRKRTDNLSASAQTTPAQTTPAQTKPSQTTPVQTTNSNKPQNNTAAVPVSPKVVYDNRPTYNPNEDAIMYNRPKTENTIPLGTTVRVPNNNTIVNAGIKDAENIYFNTALDISKQVDGFNNDFSDYEKRGEELLKKQNNGTLTQAEAAEYIAEGKGFDARRENLVNYIEEKNSEASAKASDRINAANAIYNVNQNKVVASWFEPKTDKSGNVTDTSSYAKWLDGISAPNAKRSTDGYFYNSNGFTSFNSYQKRAEELNERGVELYIKYRYGKATDEELQNFYNDYSVFSSEEKKFLQSDVYKHYYDGKISKQEEEVKRAEHNANEAKRAADKDAGIGQGRMAHETGKTKKNTKDKKTVEASRRKEAAANAKLEEEKAKLAALRQGYDMQFNLVPLANKTYDEYVRSSNEIKEKVDTAYNLLNQGIGTYGRFDENGNYINIDLPSGAKKIDGDENGYQILKYGTEEQKKTYLYMYYKYGDREASKYAAKIRPLTDAAYSAAIGERYINGGIGQKIFDSTFGMLYGGLSDFKYNMGGVGALFTGNTDYRYNNIGQIYGNTITQNTESDTWKVAQQAERSVASQLPMIAVGIATNGIAGGAISAAVESGKISSFAASAIMQAPQMTLFTLSSLGGSYSEAINQGLDYKDALAYATVSTIVEDASEILFGGSLVSVGGSVLKRFGAKSIAGLVAKTKLPVRAKEILASLGSWVVNGLGEGLEEISTEMLNPYIKKKYLFIDYDEDGNVRPFSDEHWKNIWESFFAGFLAGEMMGVNNIADMAKAGLDTRVLRVAWGQATEEDFNAIVNNEGIANQFEKAFGVTLSDRKNIALEQIMQVSNGAKSRIAHETDLEKARKRLPKNPPKDSAKNMKAIADAAQAEINRRNEAGTSAPISTANYNGLLTEEEYDDFYANTDASAQMAALSLMNPRDAKFSTSDIVEAINRYFGVNLTSGNKNKAAAQYINDLAFGKATASKEGMTLLLHSGSLAAAFNVIRNGENAEGIIERFGFTGNEAALIRLFDKALKNGSVTDADVRSVYDSGMGVMLAEQLGKSTIVKSAYKTINYVKGEINKLATGNVQSTVTTGGATATAAISDANLDYQNASSQTDDTIPDSEVNTEAVADAAREELNSTDESANNDTGITMLTPEQRRVEDALNGIGVTHDMRNTFNTNSSREYLARRIGLKTTPTVSEAVQAVAEYQRRRASESEANTEDGKLRSADIYVQNADGTETYISNKGDLNIDANYAYPNARIFDRTKSAWTKLADISAIEPIQTDYKGQPVLANERLVLETKDGNRITVRADSIADASTRADIGGARVYQPNASRYIGTVKDEMSKNYKATARRNSAPVQNAKTGTPVQNTSPVRQNVQTAAPVQTAQNANGKSGTMKISDVKTKSQLADYVNSHKGETVLLNSEETTIDGVSNGMMRVKSYDGVVTSIQLNGNSVKMTKNGFDVRLKDGSVYRYEFETPDETGTRRVENGSGSMQVSDAPTAVQNASEDANVRTVQSSAENVNVRQNEENTANTTAENRTEETRVNEAENTAETRENTEENTAETEETEETEETSSEDTAETIETEETSSEDTVTEEDMDDIDDDVVEKATKAVESDKSDGEFKNEEKADTNRMDAFKEKAVNIEDIKGATDTVTAKAVRLLKKIGKGFNVDIYVGSDDKLGADGFYEPAINGGKAKIYLNEGGSKPIFATIKHEIVHDMRITNESGYQALADALKSAYTQKYGYGAFNDYIIERRRVVARLNGDTRYNGLTIAEGTELAARDIAGSARLRDLMTEEFVADFGMDMFQNADRTKDFVRENRGAAKSFHDAAKRGINKFLDIITGGKVTIDNREKAIRALASFSQTVRSNGDGTIFRGHAPFDKSLPDEISEYSLLQAERILTGALYGNQNISETAKGNLSEKGTEYNEKGQPVAESDGNGHMQFSISTYREDGREMLKKYLDKQVTAQLKGLKGEARDEARKVVEKDVYSILEQMDELYDVCNNFMDKYASFGNWSMAEVVRDADGKPVFSVVKPNGEYSMNLDFSLVCKKRRALDAVLNELVKRGSIGILSTDKEISQKQIVEINNIIREAGMETSCALCFVDAKRYRQTAVADNFVKKYNRLVDMLKPSSDTKVGYFNFGGNSLITDEVARGDLESIPNSDLKSGFSKLKQVIKEDGEDSVNGKIAKYLMNHSEGRKHVLVGDFVSSQGFENTRIQNEDILHLYNSAKGTGGPKATFGDVQYLNEVLSKTNFKAKAAYDVGGIRIQSFSDYVPNLVFDYIQMVGDLAAKKLPAHAYTKEALFAKQFGLTGIKINMSLIPDVVADGIAPGLDKNGNYLWAKESFDFDTAMEIQSAEGYKRNCGTIAVGISKAHILKLLADPNIRMVIPYHKSGINPIIAHMMNIGEYTDYTDVQRTRDADGKALEKEGFNFNAELQRNGADPKSVADRYLAWCDKNGYTPKFDEFRGDPNYYKLLEDFTILVDGEYMKQGAVSMTFPKQTDAFGSMSDLIGQGLELNQKLSDDLSEKVPQIVDKIEKVFGTEGNEGKRMFSPSSERAKNVPVIESVSLEEESDRNVKFSVSSTVPKKTGVAYKVFMAKDGKLYPPMVANPNDDIRYSPSSVTSEEDAEYMELSKSPEKNRERLEEIVKDAAYKAGYTVDSYHGTDADFNIFDTLKQGGKNGTAEGFGIYLTTSKDVASHYGGRLIHGYAKFNKVASSEKKTFTVSSLAKLIKASCVDEANRLMSDGGYDNLNDSLRDTWISNYVETYGGKSMDAYYREAAQSILEYNDNDMDIVQEVMSGMAIRDYKDAMRFYSDILTPTTGIDGFKTKWTWDETTGDSSDIYLAFNSNQIKDADAVTYDDDGNVIPLSERFNTENDDIRYSPSDDTVYTDEDFEGNPIPSNDNGEITVEPAMDGQSETQNVKPRQKMPEKKPGVSYYEQGEKPAREVYVQKKDNKGNVVGRGIRNVLEAEVTPDKNAYTLLRRIERGEYSHEPITDVDAKDYALRHIHGYYDKDSGTKIAGIGYENALHDLLSRDAWSKNDTAVAFTLYNDMSNHMDVISVKDRKGVSLVEKLVSRMVSEATLAGQKLQAQRLLKQMTPQGMLYDCQQMMNMLNKDIERGVGQWVEGENRRIKNPILQEETSGRKYANGQPPLKMNKTLVDKLLASKNPMEALDARDAILADLGSQIRSTAADKVRAWRYMAMLFNPRTHARNVIGNALFGLGVQTKENVNAALEKVFIRDKSKRTVAFINGKNRGEFRAFEQWANDYFGGHKKEIDSKTGRYDQQMNDIIEENIKVWRSKFGKPFETIRKFNMDALDIEDKIFLKKHFVRTFAKEMIAKGYTMEQFTNGQIAPDIVEAVTRRASIEAQRATFHDASKVAEALNTIAKSNPALDIAVASIVPFKKTPINIMKRGVEYSPIGIIKGIGQIVKQNVQYNNGRIASVDTAGIVKSFSEGLTGTALAALGYFLGSLGIIRIGGGDDDKEKIKEAEGHQAYALEIGNFSFTLDWAAPLAMPLFLGAQFYDDSHDDDGKWNGLFNADDDNPLKTLANIVNPVLELSMMQSVMDTIKTIQGVNESEADVAGDLLVNVLEGYIFQFAPSIVAATARTADPYPSRTARSSYKGLKGDAEYVIRSLVNKTIRVGNKPYTDVLGNVEKKKNFGEYILSGLENFLIPGYVSIMTGDIAETHLSDMADKTDSTSFLPNNVKSFNVGKESHKLTHDEYYEYRVFRGSLYDDAISALVDDEWYNGLSDEGKTEVLSDFKELANAAAKNHIVSEYVPNTTAIADVVLNGCKTDEVIAYLKEKYNGSEAAKIDAVIAAGGTKEDFKKWNDAKAGKTTNMAKTDALLKLDIPEKVKEVIFKTDVSENMAEKYDACMDAGVSQDVFFKSYVEMQRLDKDEKLDNQGKRAGLYKYVHSLKLGEDKENTIMDNLLYWTGSSVKETAYEKMVKDGVDANTAEKYMELISESEDKEKVDKLGIIVESEKNGKKQHDAARAILPDDEYKTVGISYAYGVSVDKYTEYQKRLPKYDYNYNEKKDGSHSYDRDELIACLDDMKKEGLINDSEAAVLWQIETTAKPTKGKNTQGNPYSEGIGANVYNAKERSAITVVFDVSNATYVDYIMGRSEYGGAKQSLDAMIKAGELTKEKAAVIWQADQGGAPEKNPYDAVVGKEVDDYIKQHVKK